MDILKSLTRLGVGVVSAGLLALALVAMSLARAARSEMITIKPELFMHLAATVIAIVAVWKLLASEFKIAAKLGVMAMTGFVLANGSVKMPGTWSRGEAAIREMDEANARAALEMETPDIVPCTAPPFVGANGTPRYLWSAKDNPPVCYRKRAKKPGDPAPVHPVHRTPLEDVDSEEKFAMILREQAEAKESSEAQKVAEAEKTAEPAPTPQPVVTEAAVPAPTPTTMVAEAVPEAPAVAMASGPMRISAKPLRPPQAEQK